MNPTLYNPKTGITATPNANVTPIQQSSAMSQGFAPISSNSSSSPITVDMIGARPLALPNITSPIPTTITVNPPQGTQIDTNGNAIVNPTNTTTTTEPTKSNYQKILESIGLANDKLASKGDVTTQLQNDLQLAQRTENAVADYNAYNKKKLEVQQTINSMYDKTGGTTAGTQEAINNYSRRENANLANLAIIAQSSQGLLDSARQTIKDKVEAQFQPIQDQIDYLTRYAQLNQNDLSEKEKYQLEQQANQKKTDLANITKTAGDLHQNMLSNKAPQSVYTALDKITNDYIAGKITATDAQSKMYQAVGSYGTSIKDEIDRANVVKTYAEVAKLKDNQSLLSIKDAQSLGVPYGTTKGDAIAMGKVPGVQSSAQELKVNALQSAKDLLAKMESGIGTSAVGTSRIFGLQYIPGTAPADFTIQFDNLKSLLSLDNVKLLKGQGQVSDAERRLLSDASAKLSLSQSEGEFKTALQNVIKGLSGNQSTQSTETPVTEGSLSSGVTFKVVK